MGSYIELCAGCGGISYGLELAGWKSKLLVEIEKSCVQTLITNFPDANIRHSDMRKVDYKPFKDQVDLVIGGIPCQSFSVAGQKKGLEDSNKGALFYDFVRCLEEVTPPLCAIENVHGLLIHDNGKTLKHIVEKLESLGYTVDYKILNAVEYNVPQKRKRLIIVGRLSNIPVPWPEKYEHIPTVADGLKDVPESAGVSYSEKKKAIMNLIPAGGCWTSLPEEKQKEYLGKSYYSGGGKRGIAKRLSWDEPCLTLTTSPAQKQTERSHPEETRPLTIREYARIQTFPDSFEFSGSVAKQYMQIGNAVPPLLGFEIGIMLMKMMTRMKKLSNLDSYMICCLQAKIESKSSSKNKIILQNNLINMLRQHIRNCFHEFYVTKLHEIYHAEVKITKNCVVDPLKKALDKKIRQISDEEWNNFDAVRIADKQVSTKIGELHEFVMMNLDGWKKCPKGIHADIMKEDESIFIELKNASNTMNNASKNGVLMNLQKIRKSYPDAIIAIGIINANGSSSTKVIDEKNNILLCSGQELYKLVTGSNNYMEMFLEVVNEYDFEQLDLKPKKEPIKKTVKQSNNKVLKE